MYLPTKALGPLVVKPISCKKRVANLFVIRNANVNIVSNGDLNNKDAESHWSFFNVLHKLTCVILCNKDLNIVTSLWTRDVPDPIR